MPKISLPDKPLVSVITVCLNSEKYLEQTIQSVINQTYDNIEYIIIDGGSTDKTLDIIKKYEDRIDYWVSEPDKGIYDAMNKGISFATGELVGIINSDDYYAEDAVEAVVNRYNQCGKNTLPEMFYGYLSFVDENGKILREVKQKCEKLMEGCNFIFYFNHPTCFVPKIIYERFRFNQKFKILGDWDFFHRVLNYGYELVQIKKTIAYYRTEGISDRPCYVSKIEKYRIRKIICGRSGALFYLIRETWQYWYELMYRKKHFLQKRQEGDFGKIIR